MKKTAVTLMVHLVRWVLDKGELKSARAEGAEALYRLRVLLRVNRMISCWINSLSFSLGGGYFCLGNGVF